MAKCGVPGARKGQECFKAWYLKMEIDHTNLHPCTLAMRLCRISYQEEIFPQPLNVGWPHDLLPPTECFMVLLLYSLSKACPTLCNPRNCSPPDSSVIVILQARILKWVAILFSRVSSWPRDQTWVSCRVGEFFTIWTTREAMMLPFIFPESYLLLLKRE